jgi:hypothetical protein
MRKVLLTTIFWALIAVIAWFYLKFMDQDMGKIVSDRIITAQPDTGIIDWTLSGSGENLDPTQLILSWVITMQQQLINWLSGLNTKLDEAKVLLETNAKPKIGLPPVIKPDVKTWANKLLNPDSSTWTN